jgi:hypothetical protein
MAKFPEWVYEGLSTMLFTMVTMSAWAASKNILDTGMAVGMSYALIHVVFNSHCKAYMNPILCAAKYVQDKDSNLLDTLLLLVGEYLGAACGVGLLGALTDLTLVDVARVTDSNALVILVIMAAFLVKLFWANTSDTGLPDAIWFALAIACISCLGLSEKNNHMANPAIYTANAVLRLVSNPLSLDLSFFGGALAENLAMYAGALVSVLVSGYQH